MNLILIIILGIVLLFTYLELIVHSDTELKLNNTKDFFILIGRIVLFLYCLISIVDYFVEAICKCKI